MKILHIIPYFAPAWGFGGPVKVSFELAKRTAQKGHKVAVAATDAYDYNQRIEKLHEFIEPVEVFRFRNLNPNLAKGLNLYLPLGFKKFIIRNLKNYDLAHLHSFFTYQNIEARKFCRKYKIPYVLHLHESPIPVKEKGKLIWKKIFNAVWGKKILRDAKKILVLTSKEKDDLTGFMPDLVRKIEILPNGIKLAPRKKTIGFQKNHKTILALSRLSYIKGIDRLIEAFALLSREDPAYWLVIAGGDEAEERKKLEKLVDRLGIKKKVRFVGHVTGQKKEKIYRSADIYALFSRYDAFGMTVLEALEQDLPVCLSKEVGVAKDVMGFKCGNLVEQSENPAAGAKALRQTYQNRAALSKNCRRALKQFDINHIVDKLISTYKKALKPS